MPISLSVAVERWPVAGAFTIARGSRTEAVVVTATLSDGQHRGRGECVPYARYGETPESAVAAIEAMRTPIGEGLDGTALQSAMRAGAARNALDCAFWDLAAKRSGTTVAELTGFAPLRPLVTAYTISLGDPAAMARAASQAAHRQLLKVKLGGDGDPERLRAVRGAAPASELIADANEAWSDDNLAENFAACLQCGVTLVEQPLPAGRDDALAAGPWGVSVCADESLHDRASLAALRGKYDAINIKLDKAGGLTEALALAAEAERSGFSLMVGCMLSTSLSIAPAMLVAQRARVVDLDGALLLAKDRPDGLRYEESLVYPAMPELWG